MASSVTRYQPDTGVVRLPDMVDRLIGETFVAPAVFDRFLSGTRQPSLPVNLYETGDTYVLQAALPGLSAENLDIQVMGREVSIKGKFEFTAPENAGWLWRGIPNGEFYETYTLPVEVDGNKVEARYENGIVSITLPKAEHLRPKNIKVSVSK